ncbi:hypothetical protein [Hyalangium sp.]|uniref:hypothetical protein n=1 Tax=Hyalangium sp. TaxID=2028555 RepID=UPI002D44A9AF|nr:hypothetical protein [Hyalangium sp.]HYI01858.1 hypothetical protein [Hyalangium sp.]
MKRWMSVLALPLCACGASELPLPSIVSVAPTSMAANERILLTVNLEGTFPFKVAYSEDSAELVTSARLGIGEQTFDILRTEEKGYRLLSEVGEGLPVGPHELRVELTDGRQVVFEDGFEVTQPIDITGIAIDPIATQIRLKPFRVILRAQGPDAELFQGRVNLSVSNGTMTPTQSSPFNQGVLLQEDVTVDAPGGSFVTITAMDSAGHSVTSNSFRVLAN